MGVSLTDALASPLLASAAQGAFSVGATRAQRRWSEKMYKKYNSPEALVRQYQEAGINPALMFGQSPIAAPTESSAAVMPDNPVGDVVGLLGQLMQLDMLDEQKRGLTLDNASKEFELGLRRKYGEAISANEVNRGLAEIRKLSSESSLNEYERKFIKPIQRLLINSQNKGLSLDNLEKQVSKNFYDVYGYYPSWPMLQKGLGVLDMVFHRDGLNSAAGLRVPTE